MKFKSFQDLKEIQQKIKATQARIKIQEIALRAQQEKVHAEQTLFIQTVGAVRPLAAKHQQQWPLHLQVPAPAPIPLPRQQDKKNVQHAAISDDFDVSTLLHTDETLSFRRPGIGFDTVQKLSRGAWSIGAQIDLHGLRIHEARETLAEFIRQAHTHNLRCIRVIHGKGLGSPGKTPVLKRKVHSWLVQKQEVIAFVQAQPSEGGTGALVVLLKSRPI